MHKLITSSALGLILSLAASGHALAAAPDWSKVPSKKIVLLYPGASPMEWITKGTEHGGAKAFKKGERCVDCHSDETADMGKKIVLGQKNEPKPIKGKAGEKRVKTKCGQKKFKKNKKMETKKKRRYAYIHE